MSWKYDPNKDLHQILSSERVNNKSKMFVMTNKLHYNGD